MNVPLDIRFHHLDSSQALEQVIRERVERLEHIYDRLTSCHVAVEAPHHQHRKGNLFEVHVDLGVPGGSLAVTREPHAHPDVYQAMREAFDAAERRLQTFKMRQRQPAPELPGVLEEE
jgi:ribosomal subunit interface protein